MTTQKLQTFITVLGLPTLASVLTGFSALTLYSYLSINSNSHSFSFWLELLALAATTLVAGSFTLWWMTGLIYSLACLALARFKGQEQADLPRWIPAIIKGSAAGLLGISVLVSPTYAIEASPAPAISTSQLPQPSPLFSTNQTLTPQKTTQPATPFFSESPATQRTISLTLTSSQITEDTAATRAHTPLSPLFGAHPAPKKTSPKKPEPTRSDPQEQRTHTVASGDTLWSIAESHLPADATGQEILTLVTEIQASNKESLPTLDTFIYPGQVLTLPSPTER